jgi:hypothetical protein
MFPKKKPTPLSTINKPSLQMCLFGLSAIGFGSLAIAEESAPADGAEKVFVLGATESEAKTEPGPYQQMVQTTSLCAIFY